MNRQSWLPFQSDRSATFAAARVFFLGFLGCAVAAHGQSPAPAAASTPNILVLLTGATVEKVELSHAEKAKIKGGNYSREIKKCNRNDYNDDHIVEDASAVCSLLAGALESSLGPTSHAVELAYLRACAFPHHYGTDRTCADLGSFYEKRGDYATAMAVFLHAPHCDKPGQGYFDQKQCLDAADRLSVKMADKQLQAKILKRLCYHFSDPVACRRLNKEFGGSADLAAADAKYNGIMNSMGPVFGFGAEPAAGEAPLFGTQSVAEAEDAQTQEAQQDARDLAIGVLRGMPGASDPNAILNAANRQAAAIRAIGDANAARQQQAAEARMAAQESAAHSAAAASNSSADSWSLLLNTQAPVGNSPSANGTGATGNSSPSANSTANYAAPLPGSCIRQFWDPNYYNWLSFQNTCNQAVRVDFIAANPSDTYGMSAKDLAAGQADNTGWSQGDVSKKGGFVLFVCPAGYLAVDSSTNQPISRANQNFRCKQQ